MTEKNGEEVKMKPSKKLELVQQSLYNTQRRLGEMEMIVYNLSRDNEMLREALQLIHNKIECVISLSNEGQPLTKENIDQKIVDLKEQNLKDIVQKMLDEDRIEASDSVKENSIVVSRELEKDGTVVNPRLQFLVAKLNEELQVKFIGKNKGDLVEGEENKLNIEIMEIYDLKEQELKIEQEEQQEAQAE